MKAHQESLRILLAEDHPMTRRALRVMLEEEGHEVLTACNGAEALEMVGPGNPDLVLLDLGMPEVDGFETCRALRSRPDRRTLPIVVLTAAGELEARIRSYELDVDDVLVKPVLPQELFARIRSLTRLQQLRQQQYRERERTMKLECELELARSRHEEQKRYAELYAEVVGAVTGGRLRLVETAAMDEAVSKIEMRRCLKIDRASAVTRARQAAYDLAVKYGAEQDRAHDFGLCVTEATANVVKHAKQGWIDFGQEGDSVYALVVDGGPGLRFEDLTLCTLVRGFSTKASMGMGFALMLDLLDGITLETGPGGTRLLLEMSLVPQETDIDDLLAQFSVEDTYSGIDVV